MAGGGELISRDALERIIQRAAELQAGERDIGEGLTQNELLALGKDVGIPARYLHQALLEEQTRTTAVPVRGMLGWLFGPTTLAAERVVPGERAAVERALGHWMEQEESLQVKRRFPDHTTWEPKKGAFATIQRALGSRGKSFALARTHEVAGQVTPLEPGFCHVRLMADIRNLRGAFIGGAAGLLSAGAAGSAVALALGVLMPFPVLPVAVLALAAVPVARAHVRQNERVLVSLEQVLDRLERGEIRAEHALPGPRESAFVRIAEEIRKTFQV